MIEYNERCMVSRLLIPALLEDIFTESPQLRESWKGVFAAIGEGDIESIERSSERIGQIIDLLPETMTLEEVKN